MTEYHDFIDPRDGSTKEWSNPQRARCPVCHMTPTLPRSITSQTPQWDSASYDQWVRTHDCIAEQYDLCNDRAYSRETERIFNLCQQHQNTQPVVQLEEQTAGQAASTLALTRIAQKPRRERPENQTKPKHTKRQYKGKHVPTPTQLFSPTSYLTHPHLTNHDIQSWAPLLIFRPALAKRAEKHAFEIVLPQASRPLTKSKSSPLPRNIRIYYYYKRKLKAINENLVNNNLYRLNELLHLITSTSPTTTYYLLTLVTAISSLLLYEPSATLSYTQTGGN